MAKETTETKDTSVPKNDAYTGMLVISLLALIGGTALLYLDWSQYPANPPAMNVPAFTPPKAAEKGGEKGPDAGKKDGEVNPPGVPPMPPMPPGVPPMPEQKGGKG